MPVMNLQVVAIAVEQALPTQLRRDNRFSIVGRQGLLMGHFKKEQKGNLLRISHVGKAIITQDMGKIPRLVDDLLCVIAHAILAFFRSPLL